MVNFKHVAIATSLALAFATYAQDNAPAPSVKSGAGVSKMQSLMDALKSGQYDDLPEETRKALNSGVSSGKAVANSMEKAPAASIEKAIKLNDDWQRQAREAYVSALPPRDQARGASLLLGDGTRPGDKGKLYFFVSRSMPMSMLRAYALDALYTGGTLVVKGIRKGQTIKEYIEETVYDFNSVDGQLLSGIEVNPNLFDMFKVDVVPAVVWTNRVGLDDVGSGCEDLPEGAPSASVSLAGPNDETITMDKPTCAPVPESSYYKISGALTLPYVLDRFEEAGLAKSATATYRAELANRNSNVHQGGFMPAEGNAIAYVSEDFKMDSMPKHVLLHWQKSLAQGPVQHGPFGPTFNPNEADDTAYREKLEKKIRHGLGIRD